MLVEVRGPAPSVNQAVELFSRPAGFYLDAMAVCTNAAIRQLEPYLAYDNTPGQSTHEFVQTALPTLTGMPRITRRVPLAEAETLFNALAAQDAALVALLGEEDGHREAQRFRRAISHYNRALIHWRPGREIMAIEHLWIAVEVLSPLLLDRQRRETGMRDRDLAISYGVKARDWDGLKTDRERASVMIGALRRHLIFEDDKDSYSNAKDASNEYEHGYESFFVTHEKAEAVRDKTAAHVRAAILSVVDIPDATRKALAGPRYDTVAPWQPLRRFRGTLTGAADQLAAPGEAHPHLVWEVGYSVVAQPADQLLSSLRR